MNYKTGAIFSAFKAAGIPFGKVAVADVADHPDIVTDALLKLAIAV